MIQVGIYLKGERDYVNITGPTGPLVWVSWLQTVVPAYRGVRYPAGHIYAFRFLYDVTSGGRNIPLAQQIFAALYVVSLILACAIYRQARGTPNWIVCLLPLSKRLHSIFVLRLFNDCWSVVAVQAAILAYQTGWDDIGTLMFRYVPGYINRNKLTTSLKHCTLDQDVYSPLCAWITGYSLQTQRPPCQYAAHNNHCSQSNSHCITLPPATLALLSDVRFRPVSHIFI